MSETGLKGGPAVAEHGEHDPNLAHHFDTPEQQFESGKLGMWLFLATEILLFGGLFVAYSVYRANHPEIFAYAHQFLDKRLGALNTVVLICSSLSMAWAVRAAQTNNRKALIALLIVTLLCAATFLGVKKVEYEQKWEHGLLWGKRFNPQVHEGGEHAAAAQVHDQHAAEQGAESVASSAGAAEGGVPSGSAPRGSPTGGGAGGGLSTVGEPPASMEHPAAPALKPVIPAAPPPGTAPSGGIGEKSALPQASPPPEGLAVGDTRENPKHPRHRPSNVHLFFGIYFIMTGLHGIHVIAGMVAITWILIRSVKGQFSSDYFTPVDLTGLYWHLVDLIWIFLFPLFYLIS